jgi:hypothetical protein
VIYLIIGFAIFFFRFIIKNDDKYLICISSIMIFVAGLRGTDIGIDTKNYYSAYCYMTYYQFDDMFKTTFVEPGYNWTMFLFNKLGLDFNVYLFFAAVLFMYSTSLLIKRYSNNVVFSVFLFYTLGYYSFGLSALRQTVAISWIILAFLNRDKLWRCFIYVLLGISFHITASIFVLVFFVSKIPLNKIFWGLYLFSFGLVVLFKGNIISILNTYARLQYDITDGNLGNLYFLYYLIMVIIGIFLSNYLQEKCVDANILLKILLLNLVIFYISSFNPATTRLSFYFSIFQIVFLPNILHFISNKNMRIGGYFVYSCFALYVFYITYYSDFLSLYPYYYFWE